METINKEASELSTYKKRIEILVGARFKETDKISSAVNTQNKIRQKIKGWHGAEEIKKWRMRN